MKRRGRVARGYTMATSAENERRSGATIERHVQTIMITLITGALFFAANYFYTDNKGKAVQQTQLEVLTSQVIEMRADLKSLQANYVKHSDFKDLESRVRVMELRPSK